MKTYTGELKSAATPEVKIQLQKMEEVLQLLEIENITKEGALKAVLKGEELSNTPVL